MTKHKIKFVETPVREYKPKFFGKSVIEGIETVPINLPPDYYIKKFHEYESKLKKYKDIEEKLGIDLVTLFKALKEGFYYRNFGNGLPKEILFADPSNEECGIECYTNYGDSGHCIFGLVWAGLGVAFVDQYGKSWALTKEELE